MSNIAVLDQATINQIAAGEVVERPASVVKELVENAIDAGATAITVEIKDGGISFLRVTDNGSGIEAQDIPLAFLRHSTSKIRSAIDLLTIGSLGFRGEALSSIAAVAQVELLTKTKDAFIGSRYMISGGQEQCFEEIGCPAGTTFIVRNLFYNTPARRKFLKTAVTESGYISELMERMALSHPDISFKFMNNGKILLHTTGSGELRDIIYHVFGRDTVSSLLEIASPENTEGIVISGFIGKPVLTRNNRVQENYFINGRFIRCNVVSRAIEDAYKSYMMGHKYPFTALHFSIPSHRIDVNVHPTKMELRFSDGEAMYRMIYHAVRNTLAGKNMMVPISLSEKEEKAEAAIQKKEQENRVIPEPFEQHRQAVQQRHSEQHPEQQRQAVQVIREQAIKEYPPPARTEVPLIMEEQPQYQAVVQKGIEPCENKLLSSENQLQLPLDFLNKREQRNFRMIGQLFSTYWLIEMEQQLFIIDQHAAHEKVLFERTMKKLHEKEEIISQNLFPPVILSFSIREAECFQRNEALFQRLGYEIEHFGGQEYKLTAAPADFITVNPKELLYDVINTLVNEREYQTSDVLLERVASLSCKAAVKGNHSMSETEAKQLIADMLTLENPYHCPHGRPTTISMSKYELERKFKRIIT